MLDQMKKMMEMKKQADKIKKELDKVIIECTDVRGIKVTINGSQYLQAIDVDDSWLNPDQKKRFHQELVRAVNLSVKKAQKAAAQKMQSMPGFNLPGLS